MTEEVKVTVVEVEQSLLKAIKNIVDTGTNSPDLLDAVNTYSQALQRLHTTKF